MKPRRIHTLTPQFTLIYNFLNETQIMVSQSRRPPKNPIETDSKPDSTPCSTFLIESLKKMKYLSAEAVIQSMIIEALDEGLIDKAWLKNVVKSEKVDGGRFSVKGTYNYPVMEEEK